MKNKLPLITSVALLAGAASAHAAVLAGFYTAPVSATLTDLDGISGTDYVAAQEFTTGIDARATGLTRDLTFGSNDGFYGGTTNVVAGGAVVDNFVTRASNTNTYRLTNNTGNNVSIESISFDFWNGGNSWYGVELRYRGGDLLGVDDGILVGDTLSGLTANIAKDSDWFDIDYSLTSLADFTLANGESASFEFISVKNGATGNSLAGVDNIAFIGTVGAIPEPSAALLGGLGLLTLLRRRR